MAGSADIAESLLVRELLHRVNNDFTALIGAASRASASIDDPSAQAAIARIVEAIYAQADVNRALQIPDAEIAVDLGAYLESLCKSISRSKLATRNINLVLAVPQVRASSVQCWKLGMITSELITNSVRHAFDTCGGEIRVELSDLGDRLKCCISDNGRGTARLGSRRSGLSIITGLVSSMRGTLEQRFGGTGSSTTVCFPARQIECPSPATPS